MGLITEQRQVPGPVVYGYSRPGRRRIAAGRIPPVNGMPNGTEFGRTRLGSGNERLDLNPNQEVTWKGH